MDDLRLGRLVRLLRHRRHWRQEDLARRAGVGRTVISALELGRVDGMTLGTIRRVMATLGLSSEITVRGLGGETDRLLDEGHARLVGVTSRWLTGLGWEVRAEISYSEWGERGSIDLLAWHSPTRTLLVIEIKTELASIEATLRKHDEKVRLASTIALKRFGWGPKVVAGVLVLPDQATQRRRVAAHADVLDRAFPARTRAVRAWCRTPEGELSGLMFLSDSATSRTTNDQGRRERVRQAPGSAAERGRSAARGPRPPPGRPGPS